MTIPNQYNHTN